MLNRHSISSWLVILLIAGLPCGFRKADAGENPEKLPAFPGAEGFGRFASGGRGGDVYHATNLNDSGPGSLREGIQSAKGPRTIVFDVSGTIHLNSELRINKPNLTIAGQTAPGDGICVSGHSVGIATHDVVLRHVRARLSDKNRVASDALSINNASNIIVDHVSAGWAVDETLSVSGSDNVTVQWCLISESLDRSVHPKGAHGYGSLIRGSNGAKYTFHHNLWAHHRSRMPRPGNYKNHESDPQGLLADFRNNVFYNWSGSAGGYNSDKNSISIYNFINNYYKRGPNSSGSYAFREACPYAQAYFAGNSMNGAEPDDPWRLVDFRFQLDTTSTTHNESGRVKTIYMKSTPLEAAAVATEPAPKAYENVLAKVGAFPRDPADLRVIESVMKGTGRIINSQAEVGGFPQLKSAPAPTDSDKDGMPDAWEKARQLDPQNPEDRNGDDNRNGYPNLEEYLNSLCATAK